MATKALQTTSIPDTLNKMRKTKLSRDTGEQTHIHICLLLVASQIGSAFQKRKLAACNQRYSTVCPFGHTDSTWGNTSQGNYTCSFPHAPKETFIKFFKTHKWKNLYIFKGTGAPKYKRMKKKRTSEWTMWICVTCGCASSLHVWNIGVTIIILSHEDTSGVNEFMHERTYNSTWHIGNTH